MRGPEQNSLEAFAIRIEKRLLAAGDTSTMESLVCRHLTNKKNPTTAARMMEKLVEWRYGKAKETIKHEGTVTHEHIDLSHLSDEQIRQVESLIESAALTGSDKG